MIEKRIKQVLIYREDDYWTWQIVDVARRELFADTVYYSRDEAVSGAADDGVGDDLGVQLLRTRIIHKVKANVFFCIGLRIIIPSCRMEIQIDGCAIKH